MSFGHISMYLTNYELERLQKSLYVKLKDLMSDSVDPVSRLNGVTLLLSATAVKILRYVTTP